MGQGYISAALLARIDARQTFPRMPFEPISRETYEKLIQEVQSRRKSSDFAMLLDAHDRLASDDWTGTGDGACTSVACIAKHEEMEHKGAF